MSTIIQGTKDWVGLRARHWRMKEVVDADLVVVLVILMALEGCLTALNLLEMLMMQRGLYNF